MHHFTRSKDTMAARANKAGRTGKSRAESRRFPSLGQEKQSPHQHLPPSQTIEQVKHCLQIQFNEPGRQFGMRVSMIVYESSGLVCRLSVVSDKNQVMYITII